MSHWHVDLVGGTPQSAMNKVSSANYHITNKKKQKTWRTNRQAIINFFMMKAASNQTGWSQDESVHVPLYKQACACKKPTWPYI